MSNSASSTLTRDDPPAAGAPTPLRLLVLNYEYPPLGGGASPVTAQICRELTARGHRVDVLTMAYRGLPRTEASNGLRILRIPCLRRDRHLCRAYELATWILSALFLAPRLARREKYDLVHAHFFFPCAVVALWLKRTQGIPYAVTAHGSDVPGYNPDRFRLMHRLLAPAWRTVVRAADLVISPSRSLAALIDRNLGTPRPIEIVPNGIQRDWIAPTERREPQILVVCRLFERKGVQYLLRALAKGPLTHDVHIVGDGPHRAELERLAREVPDRIHFHGWLEPGSPAMLDLYRRSSIFVFPSVAENFPISLLEAMLAGLAIVSSSLDACREVLGDAALYFPPEDDAALREILTRLSADTAEQRRLGERARARVLDFFTWDRVGARYEELLLAQRRGARCDS